MFSYKDILVNYGSMVDEAPSKEKGLILANEDWKAKKQQMNASIDTVLVDVGICLIEESKNSFDMQEFVNTGKLPSYDDSQSLYGYVKLFNNLVELKKNDCFKELLDYIMNNIDANLDSLSCLHKDNFLTGINEELKINAECFVSYTVLELFEMHLETIFEDIVEELNNILPYEDRLSEDDYNNLPAISCVKNGIVDVMKHLYSDTYFKIRHNILGI